MEAVQVGFQYPTFVGREVHLSKMANSLFQSDRTAKQQLSVRKEKRRHGAKFFIFP